MQIKDLLREINATNINDGEDQYPILLRNIYQFISIKAALLINMRERRVLVVTMPFVKDTP